MSIFRRRLMMGEKKPIEYLEFEDRRVWEICAYRWGDTYNIQEMNGAGGVLGSGELEGNNDTLVYSDYMFAATYAIGAHGSVPATAARTVQYRVEIVVEGGRALDGENAPWDIATASAVGNAIFYPVQYGTTMSATALGTITAENWADPTFWASQTILTDGGAVGANARKYTALITTTNACQYLRLGIRAVAGTSISWKFVSVGVTKLPQGITKSQCAAVSSIGTVFLSNSIIENIYDIHYLGISSLTSYAFQYCTGLTDVTFPNNIKSIERSIFNRAAMSTFSMEEGGITVLSLGFLSSVGRIERAAICEGVTTVGYQCFYNCQSLHVVDYPSTITSMGDEVHLYGRLSTFIMRAANPPTLSSSNMFRYGYVPTIYVPDESVSAYKTAQYWSTWASSIKPISQLPE